MKVRRGFISNSSSSSFVVKLKDFVFREGSNECPIERLLTKEQEKLLLDYGFKPTHDNEGTIERLSKVRQNKKGWNLGYYDICNQDDTTEFLIKHKIPFKGSHHYGHEAVIYNGKDLFVIPNEGNHVLTYEYDKLDKKENRRYSKYKVDRFVLE